MEPGKYAIEAAHQMWCDELIPYNQIGLFASYIQRAIDKALKEKEGSEVIKELVQNNGLIKGFR